MRKIVYILLLSSFIANAQVPELPSDPTVISVYKYTKEPCTKASEIKPSSYVNDETGTDAPPVLSPANPPADPADQSTLVEVYNDLTRYWVYDETTVTWAYVVDVEKCCETVTISNVIGATPPAAGNEGDEFINVPDAFQWIHDGNTWVLRPTSERPKPTKRVTANYTVDYDVDGLVLVDASAGDITITLPAASSRPDDENSWVDIKVINNDNNNFIVYLDGAGSDLLEGVTTPYQIQLMETVSPKAEPAANSWWIR